MNAALGLYPAIFIIPLLQAGYASIYLGCSSYFHSFSLALSLFLLFLFLFLLALGKLELKF